MEYRRSVKWRGPITKLLHHSSKHSEWSIVAPPCRISVFFTWKWTSCGVSFFFIVHKMLTLVPIIYFILLKLKLIHCWKNSLMLKSYHVAAGTDITFVKCTYNHNISNNPCLFTLINRIIYQNVLIIIVLE